MRRSAIPASQLAGTSTPSLAQWKEALGASSGSMSALQVSSSDSPAFSSTLPLDSGGMRGST